jgi:starvation-inducible DNA-binding protein
MDELIKTMKVTFASEYSYFVKAQFFHWNVEGSNFPQYHELFGNIYEEVYGNIDAFAENLRKLGTYAPGSFDRLSMLSRIDDETQIMPAERMLAELLADSESMCEMFKVVFMLSEQANEYGLSDFIAGRQDAHRKHAWMLKATLK